MCGSRKNTYPPPQRELEIPRGWVVKDRGNSGGEGVDDRFGFQMLFNLTQIQVSIWMMKNLFFLTKQIFQVKK